MKSFYLGFPGETVVIFNLLESMFGRSSVDIYLKKNHIILRTGIKKLLRKVHFCSLKTFSQEFVQPRITCFFPPLMSISQHANAGVTQNVTCLYNVSGWTKRMQPYTNNSTFKIAFFLVTGLTMQRKKPIVYLLKCTKQWSWNTYSSAEKTINNWFWP